MIDIRRALFHTLGMGLCGLATGALLQAVAGPGAGPWVPPNAELLWNSFFGGCAGGAISIWAFGRPGHRGIALALVGALLATALGSFVGGALFGHGFGGVLGFGATLEGLVFQPLVLAGWACAMAVLHAASIWLRKQSISP